MKKASRIVLIFGIAITFLAIIGFIVGGVIFTLFSKPEATQDIITGLRDGSITTSFTGTEAEQAEQIQRLFGILGVIFFVLAAMYLLDAIVSAFALKKNAKVLSIVVIVLNVVLGNIILVIGGVLGLIDDQEA